MERTSHSTTSEKQQNNDSLKTVCLDVLDYGDLLLVANKSHGKTIALMQLARQFVSLENTRVFVFEDFPKWVKEFDSMPYYIVQNSDVTETSHTVDLENYFLRHERSYTVRRGEELKHFLKTNKNGIFLSRINDIERTAFFIYGVVNHFYRKAYLRAFKGYSKRQKIIFMVEESQNVFDSSTISKKLFNRLRKIFSVARNLGLHFIMSSQRAQDINTKIRGRTRLMLGQISLDDYELKISRLLRHSKHRAEVLELPKGTFLYTPLDKLVKFDLFKGKGKPYPYRPRPIETTIEEPIKPKKGKLRFKVVEAFGLIPIPTIYREPTENQEPRTQTLKTEDEDEDQEENWEDEDQEDEDLLLFPEEFEDEED